MTELVGVYDADGGLAGELRYVVGHLLGRAECSLCDITHSPVRRKRSWDAMTSRVGIPWRLLHRNELTADLVDAVRVAGLPVVLGCDASGDWQVVVDRAGLRSAGGSVERFEATLREALARD